ncbi:hypothetical protein RUND412_003544 [Rhizina undulata]
MASSNAPPQLPSGPKGSNSKAAAGSSAVPPNQTLYITNLNDKIRKPDLRLALYTLFSTYGVVLDVNALKTMKGRGQAHIAFRDIASATQALRALQGFNIFGKDMIISYAKGKSHAIAKLDGTFKIPHPAFDGGAPGAAATPFAALPSAPTTTSKDLSHTTVAISVGGSTAVDGAAAVTGQKRQREEEKEEEEKEEEEKEEEEKEEEVEGSGSGGFIPLHKCLGWIVTGIDRMEWKIWRGGVT